MCVYWMNTTRTFLWAHGKAAVALQNVVGFDSRRAYNMRYCIDFQ